MTRNRHPASSPTTALLALLFLLGLPEAFAHRLEECLVATRIAVTTNRIELSLDLTPGVASAGQLLAILDPDHDQHFSEKERAAYAQRLLKDIPMELDGKPLRPPVISASFPSIQEIRSGHGLIQIKAGAAIASLTAGRHALTLTNLHLPAISVYQVNALVPKTPDIRITSQVRDELQVAYRLEFTVSPPLP